MSFFGLDTISTDPSDKKEYDLNDLETYDDLASKLVEENDDLNDETFGDFSVSKDFDFAGQTARVADNYTPPTGVLQQQNVNQTGPSASANVNPTTQAPMQPSLTSMASNQRPSFASVAAGLAPSSSPSSGFGHSPAPSIQQKNFQPIPGLWDSSATGMDQKAAKAKIPSVEEIEAQMRAAKNQQGQPQPPPGPQKQMYFPQGAGQYPYPQQQQQPQYPVMNSYPMNNQYFPQDPNMVNNNMGYPPPPPQGPQFMQIPLGMQQQAPQQNQMHQFPMNMPMKQQQQQPQPTQQQQQQPFQQPQPNNQASTPFSQVMAEDMATNDAENMRLLKKSRRIAQQYKYNNLMTAYDKNLVTKIQLNRIVSEDPFNEDFYYVVSSQIQARANPGRNAFAETYLFQRSRGGFYFGGGRSRGRHENPLQRMQQQVQQAVAYAKEHPQKEQISLEGALGKISLGTGKKPRQALVLKKQSADSSASTSTDSDSAATKDASDSTKSTDEKAKNSVSANSSLTLKTAQSATIKIPKNVRSLLIWIEDVYATLLEIESIERSKSNPVPNQPQDGQQQQPGQIEGKPEGEPNSEANPENAETSLPASDDWDAKLLVQTKKLWAQIQVVTLEFDQQDDDKSDNQNSGSKKITGNPFIEILRHNKGKRLIPRIFRHLSTTERLTVLTRIINHLDTLDVVKNGSYKNGEELKASDRASIELFLQTVLPPIVQLISESEFGVVIGLLEILISSNDVVKVAHTKIGLSILTVLISQAEFISQKEDENAAAGGTASPAGHRKVSQAELTGWKNTFDSLFHSLKGNLASLFPPGDADDSYVWHFLASLALAASLDHQRVIVDEVREKIFGVMAQAKALPPDLGMQAIENLNLFLNVMGLTATTTEIGQMS